MKQAATTKEACEIVKKAIALIENGFPTQYFSFSGWTIRIADHKANSRRIQNNMISFVVCANYTEHWCPDYEVYIDTNGIDAEGMALNYNIDYFINK